MAVRILTEEQIKKLPLHNLKRYRTAVIAERERIETDLHEYCCGMRKGCNDVVSSRQPTEVEVARIKTLDWLMARVNEQWNIKEAEEANGL
jgi:hypothetical protein